MTKVQTKERQQARQSKEVSTARSTSELSLPIPDQFNEAIGFSSKEPVVAQIVGLRDERLSIVQRQALAIQVGLRQGNRDLNRVITKSVNKDSEGLHVQRQPTREQPNGRLGNLTVSGESVQNTAPQQAIELLRNRVLFQLQMQYERDFDRHKAQKRLRDEHYIVGTVSDLAGSVRMPPLDMWTEPRRRLDAAEAAIQSGDIQQAIWRLKSAEAWLNSTHRRLYHYIEGTIEGAERAVTGLEVTRDLSFATVGAVATVATGGVGGALIGTAVTAVGQVAQQGTEISYGLRSQIDWGGITFDALFGLVTSYLGGKIGGYVAGKIIGSNPVAASLGRQAVARIVNNIVSGRAGAVIHNVARNLFDTQRGQAKVMTPAQFAHMLIEELTNPRSYFMDIVSGEIDHAVHTLTSHQSSPSESTPSMAEPTIGEPTRPTPESVGLTSIPSEPVPTIESRSSEPMAAAVAPERTLAPIEPSSATPTSTEPALDASVLSEPVPSTPAPEAEPVPIESAPTVLSEPASTESMPATSTSSESTPPVSTPIAEPRIAASSPTTPSEPTVSGSVEPAFSTEPVAPQPAEPTTQGPPISNESGVLAPSKPTALEPSSWDEMIATAEAPVPRQTSNGFRSNTVRSGNREVTIIEGPVGNQISQSESLAHYIDTLPGEHATHGGGMQLGENSPEGITSAPRSFNLSAMKAVENTIKKAANIAAETGSRVEMKIVVQAEYRVHNGENVRVLVGIQREAWVRLPGSDKTVPLIQFQARINSTTRNVVLGEKLK